MLLLVLLAASSEQPHVVDSPGSSRYPRVDILWKRLDRNTLAALSAEMLRKPSVDEPFGPFFRNDRLTIKRRSKHGWLPVASVPSGKLQTDQDGGFGFDFAKLLVGDFGKDGRSEIAVIYTYGYVSGVRESELCLYASSGGKLRLIGDLESSDPISVRRMGRRGRTQFMPGYRIGESMGHGAMPWWEDVYEVRRGRLVQVNAAFPRLFSPTVSYLRRVLYDYPQDTSVWEYFARAASYARAHLDPVKEYRAVARIARKRLRRLVAAGTLDQDGAERMKQGIRMILQWATQRRPLAGPAKRNLPKGSRVR